MPGRTDSTPRPSQHQITNSISASRGKDSLTRIRSRSSGTARAMGHQSYPSIRREVFGRIGLFDETMVRNQDIEFTARAGAAGFRIVTSPRLRCRYSPPPTLRRLVRQMFGNGLWVLLAIVGATLAWLGKAGLGAFWLPLVFVGAHVAYAIGMA